MSGCTCKPCAFCGGRGYYYVDFAGRFVEAHIDDTDQTEQCEFCDESKCDFCSAEEELQEWKDEQEQRGATR